MTIVVVMRDGGLTRFGSCPSGGTPAGRAQRSTISEEAIVIRDHGEIKVHRDVGSFTRPDPTSYEISWSWKSLELYHPRRVLVLLWGQTDSGQQQPGSVSIPTQGKQVHFRPGAAAKKRQ